MAERMTNNHYMNSGHGRQGAVEGGDIPSMLPQLNLTGPPTVTENFLMSDIHQLTLDEAIKRMNQLLEENAQLKATIQETNLSMKMACDSFAALKQKVQMDQQRAQMDHEEHLQNYNRSRSVVNELRKKLADKDKILETLKEQIDKGSELLDTITLDNKNLTYKLNNVQPPQQQLSSMTDDKDRQIELLRKSLAEKQNEMITKTQMMMKLQQDNQQLQQESQQLQKKQLLIQEGLLMDNSSTLKSQVTNLLRDQNILQNRCSNQEKELVERATDLIDSQKKFDSTQQENHRLTNQLKGITKNYEELMSDYHDLLQTNDSQKNVQQDSQAILGLKREFEERLDNLTAQLVTAEEVLTRKDEQIKTLESKLNDSEMLQAQVEIYRTDFEAERRSREDLNDRCLGLMDKYRSSEDELTKCKATIGLLEMRLRHGFSSQNLHQPGEAVYPPAATPPPPPPGIAQQPRFNEPESFQCPLCGHISPDYDSLQLHVEACIR